MNLFQIATKNKFRFDSLKGALTVEQLWDLPLSSAGSACLNEVAVKVHRDLGTTEETNFVQNVSSSVRKANRLLVQKLDLVKEIIAYKQAAELKAQKRAATQERNQQIMEIMDSKKTEAMGKSSMKKLQEMLDAGLDELDDEE